MKIKMFMIEINVNKYIIIKKNIFNFAWKIFKMFRKNNMNIFEC